MFLKCQNITYQYPSAENPVFENICFSLDKPGLHALFGPSGVGKTSFAMILAGMMTDFEGGYSVGDSKILYTYNQERLPDWSTVFEHFRKIVSPERMILLEELIDIFGLEGYMGSRFMQLSLGQKNRVNLLRYLLQDFNVLIMDESLANVDERTREKILLTMKSRFPQSCFLYISHNVIEVAKYCDEILVFRGKDKFPQTQIVKGCDSSLEDIPASRALDRTMLEIMNAF